MRGVLKVFLMIFDDVEMAKTLIFQGFVELGIEVVVWVGMLGNAYFIRSLWREQMCLVFQSNICSKM